MLSWFQTIVARATLCVLVLLFGLSAPVHAGPTLFAPPVVVQPTADSDYSAPAIVMSEGSQAQNEHHISCLRACSEKQGDAIFLVYNFEVEGTHSYFVGGSVNLTGPPAGWVWVHNSSKIEPLVKSFVEKQIVDGGELAAASNVIDGEVYALKALSSGVARVPPAYNSLNNVIKSLKATKKLPPEYITKAQAKVLGWKPHKGNLNEVAPGKTIGGDIYKNETLPLLPSAPGRVWYEADLNYATGYRGNERIVFSNDGLVYFSRHYKSHDFLFSISHPLQP